MKLKRIVTLVLFICICFSSSVSAELFSSEALLSAEAFVVEIDKNDYRSAYANAAPILKLISQQDAWVKQQGLSFRLLGKSLKRQLMTVRSRESYPGFPDGNYLIVCYQTQTEYKSKAIEVLLLKEQGQVWQVCKYSIR
jgi:Protein of unknown function (DUF4019)